MNKKSLLQKANFAPPPPLLSAVPNAVKIGAVGGTNGLVDLGLTTTSVVTRNTL